MTVATGLASLGHPDAHPLRSVDEGAYSSARRWLVELEPGRRAFVKALAPGEDAQHLRQQRDSYARAFGGLVPALLGWLAPSTELPTLLLIEDLSDARWGAPVTATDARALRATLDALAEHPARADDPPLQVFGRAPDAPLWEAFRTDPSALIGTGLVDVAWCDVALEPLAAAAARVDPTGDGVVHDDLWRQNWCVAERGAVLVDFGVSRGNPAAQRAWAECGVRAADGATGILLAQHDDDHDGWAAWMAGVAVQLLIDAAHWHADLPRLHETQLREAIAGLRWAAEALRLPLPPIRPGLEPPGPWRP